jgi:hypothetical protein
LSKPSRRERCVNRRGHQRVLAKYGKPTVAT